MLSDDEVLKSALRPVLGSAGKPLTAEWPSTSGEHHVGGIRIS